MTPACLKSAPRWPRILFLLGLASLIMVPSVPLWPLGQPPVRISLEKAILFLGFASGVFLWVKRARSVVATGLVAAGYLVALKGSSYLGLVSGPLSGINNVLSQKGLDWALVGWGTVFLALAVLSLGIEALCVGRSGIESPPGLRWAFVALGALLLLQAMTWGFIHPLEPSEWALDATILRKAMEGLLLYILVAMSPPRDLSLLGLWLGAASVGRLVWVLLGKG